MKEATSKLSKMMADDPGQSLVLPVSNILQFLALVESGWELFDKDDWGPHGLHVPAHRFH